MATRSFLPAATRPSGYGKSPAGTSCRCHRAIILDSFADQLLHQNVFRPCRMGQRGCSFRGRAVARQRLERSGKWLFRRQTTNYSRRQTANNKQTSRVWDFSTGETKMELRGHEHVVECAVFAPVNAYPAIRELAGLKVSLLTCSLTHH